MSTATFGQANHVLTLIGQKEVSKERLVALVDSGLLADLLDADPANINRDDFRKSLGLTPAEFRALVNRDLSLKEMISAGHYDGGVNSDITAERFPIVGSGSEMVEFKLVDFGRNVESDEAAADLSKGGWHAADIAEGLAFGAAFPAAQLKNPIPLLGSVAKVWGYRYVACLYRVDSKRFLYLFRWGDGWFAYYRFLAARKCSLPLVP